MNFQDQKEQEAKRNWENTASIGPSVGMGKQSMPLMFDLLQLLEKRVIQNAQLVAQIENKLHDLKNTRSPDDEPLRDHGNVSTPDAVSHLQCLSDTLSEGNIRLERSFEKLSSII